MTTRGITPCPRSGAAAERRYPTPQAQGRGNRWEELPHTSKPEAKGSGGEEQPHDRGRGGGQEDQPDVQGSVVARVQEGLEELSHLEGRKGGGEEIPLVQGKEQWLLFAGAAMKRYPMPKVRETQVRR